MIIVYLFTLAGSFFATGGLFGACCKGRYPFWLDAMLMYVGALLLGAAFGWLLPQAPQKDFTWIYLTCCIVIGTIVAAGVRKPEVR